ncbi:MAG TPA: acetate/propionate family kinase [Candidatus Kryptonia bacterium]
MKRCIWDLNILVFNCGSSSLTYKLFKVRSPGKREVLLAGKAHRVHVKGTEPSYLTFDFGGEEIKKVVPLDSHAAAASLVLDFLKDHDVDVDYIGHRFVHGGRSFSETTLVDERTLRLLEQCVALAPLHNKVALDVILVSRRILPQVKHYVVFDTAFHKTIPSYASTYPLPKTIVRRFGFKKYGFHGLSYSYVLKSLQDYLESSLENSRIVACHLGTGGSSVAAIRRGHSLDTSMGFSPLPGLVMSTRCGDIDPMMATYLMITYGYRPELLMDLFNKESGLLGISGFSSDIRDIINRYNQNGNEETDLAIKMYVHRIKKFIGSFIAELGGIDLLVFTDDIGLHNWYVRQMVCREMEWCGIDIDEYLNVGASGDEITSINSGSSSVGVWVVPNDEEAVIYEEGEKLLKNENRIAV